MKRVTIKTGSDEETRKVGASLASAIKKGALICLYGELGAGKTTFIRGLAHGLGITSRIQSPTFTFQRVHKGSIKLSHFDCYRLTSIDELIANEITAALGEKKSVVAIEWPEKVEEILPQQRINVQITYAGAQKRIIKISK